MNGMATKRKTLQKILAGSKNIRFSDMKELGGRLRVPTFAD